MSTPQKLNRRQFISTATMAAGGLVIAFNVPAGIRKQFAANADTILAPNAYLRIGADDKVSVILSHCELGQEHSNILSMLIAEELDANWESIQAEHAPAATAYYHTIYATQRTGGSTSLVSEYDRYRKAGATARYLLVQAAANRFQVNAKDCRTENGHVIIGDKKIRYGELVEDAAKLPAPADVPLKDPGNWKFIGQKVKRLDTPVKDQRRKLFSGWTYSFLPAHCPRCQTAASRRQSKKI